MEHLDAIVALSKNWTRYPPRGAAGFPLELSPESRITALAAGELYRAGIGSRIIFSGGRTAGPRYPSESSAMRDYLLSQGLAVPEEAILLEDSSLTTIENAEEVQAVLEKEGWTRIALLTVGFHLPRALRVFAARDIRATGFASEAVLSGTPRWQAVVRRYRRSPRRLRETAVEQAWRALQALGVLDAAFARRLSHRVRARENASG